MIDRTDLQKAPDITGRDQATFLRQIWGEVNGLDSRGHHGQTDCFLFFK